MATEISNGKQTIKLYRSVNRGKPMYQLAYYAGGRRVQKNFADKAETKRIDRWRSRWWDNSWGSSRPVIGDCRTSCHHADG